MRKTSSGRQFGSTLVAVIGLVAAIAAGGYAWLQTNELSKTRRELAATSSALEQAKGELVAARKETAALRTEVATHKEETEKLRGEMASTRAFLEAEKTHSARLRAELQNAKEQLAMAARYRRAPAADMLPMPVTTIPRVVVIRGSGGSAISAASPAPVPAPVQSPPYPSAR